MEKLTPSIMSMLILEGIKLLLRSKWFKLGKDYDFPVAFYAISLPVLNMISVLLLTVLSVAGYSFPTDWVGWGKEVIVVLLLSLASVGEYELTIGRLKQYNEERSGAQEI